MEATGQSFTDRAATDPTVQRQGIAFMAQQYLNGGDARSPYAAPIYGDLKGLPPLLIQVGAVETLLDDSLLLARVAGIADVVVDLQIWPEMIHVWHQWHKQLAAGRKAIASGGSFIRGMLKGV
jgi:acetyl esterase/lipase